MGTNLYPICIARDVLFLLRCSPLTSEQPPASSGIIQVRKSLTIRSNIQDYFSLPPPPGLKWVQTKVLKEDVVYFLCAGLGTTFILKRV